MEYLSGADEYAHGRYGEYSWQRNIFNVRAINKNLPFWRSVEGADHTLFVIDIDIFNISKREDKVKCAAHVVKYILDKFPTQRWLIKMSGSSFHIEQKYNKRIDPSSFRPVLRTMFSDWEEGADSHPDEPKFRRMLTHIFTLDDETIFEAGIDLSLTDRRHIISAPYSEYAKVEGVYVYPIFDLNLLDSPKELIYYAKFENLQLIPYTIPEFGFESLLVDKIPIDAQNVTRTRARRREHAPGTAKRKIAVIPKTPETEFHLNQIEELIQNSDWLCIKEALRRSREERGVFFERAPIARFIWWNYKKDLELIAHFFYWKVNDETDNLPENWGKMEHGLNFALFNHRGEEKSKDTWQSENIIRNNLCVIGCTAPCKRFIWDMSELQPIKNFQRTTTALTQIIQGEKNTIIEKSTRAGVTTSAVLMALKQNKKILVVCPTNGIARETFYNISLLAHQEGLMFRGAVIGENTRVCLNCMMEIEKAKEEFGGIAERLIAVEKLPFMLKDQCLDNNGEPKCSHWDDIYTDGVVINENGIPTPVINSNINPNRCAFATILQHLHNYNVVFLTYDKLRLIFHQTIEGEMTEERAILIDELESNFDIILLDEISRFINNPSSELKLFTQSYKLNEEMEITTEKQITYNIFRHIREVEDSDRQRWIAKLNERGKDPQKDLINRTMIEFDEHARKILDDFTPKTWGKIENPMELKIRKEVRDRFREWYSVFVEHAKRDNLFFPHILKVMELINQPSNFWFITNIPRGREIINIDIKVSPFYDDVINFVRMGNRRGKQTLITDATMPYTPMQDIFEIDFNTYNIGDPRNTSEIQLIIPDTISIYPNQLNSGGSYTKRKEELIEFINKTCRTFGANDVMLVAQNKDIWQLLLHFFEKGQIPSELDISTDSKQVTYYRSGATIGVANERRTMIVIGNPFPPKDAYQWLAQVFKDRGLFPAMPLNILSLQLWRKEAASAFQQTIGRIKDPFTELPSVVFCYGIKRTTVQQLLKSSTDNIKILDNIDKRDLDFNIQIGKIFKKTRQITGQVSFRALEYAKNHTRTKEIGNTDLPLKYRDKFTKIFSTPKKILQYYGLKIEGNKLVGLDGLEPSPT